MTLTQQVQVALKSRGFDPGPADGVPGIRTTAAVKAFQAAHGLDPDGVVGPLTLAALGIDRGPQSVPIDPPWLVILTAKKGLREQQDKKALEKWLRSDGRTLGDPAKNPWCGDAIETCILNAGYGPVPSNPYLARNWTEFGRHAAPCYGAVGAFWRGKKSGTDGHVSLLIGISADGARYRIRGGNQSNMIGDVWIAVNRLLDARMPTKWTGPEQALPVLAADGAALSTNEA